ncbi:MAG: MFS transporter [Gemmatimonadota bacterium]
MARTATAAWMTGRTADPGSLFPHSPRDPLPYRFPGPGRVRDCPSSSPLLCIALRGLRNGNLGLIGAAFGLGFIFGPALGGMLAPIGPEAPGLAAAALCFGNGILAFFLLPESLTKGEKMAGGGSPLRARDFGVALRNPRISRILILSFLFTVAFAAMQPTFPLFGAIRFGLDELHVG